MIDFGRKIKKMHGKGTEADLNRLRKGRAPWGSIILIYGVAALVGAGAFFGYRCYYESQNDGFLAGTAVDGCDVSGKTIGEAVKLIEDKYADSEIVVTENGEVDLKGDLAFYGYTMDGKALEERLQQDFAASKNDMQSVFLSLLGYYDHQIDVELSFDETTFKKNVNSASLKVTRFPSEDAYLYCDEKTRTIEVRPEVQGNEIDDKILQEYISECLAETLKKAVGQPAEAAGAELHTSYEFPAESCVKPKIYQDDEGLLTKREALNTYAGAEVTYVFGDEEMKLDLFALSEMMDINGETAELSDEKIENFVSKLGEKYDTRYIDRTFHTSYDEDIEIAAKYNDYGYTIVGEDEAEQLREDIESRKPVKREPIYIETNSWGNPYYLRRDGVDDMAGTYIEVDLTAQHMWYYRDGELYLDSPVVSGDVTKGRGTQTGCFPLAYKESPSVLTGGQGDGEYETKVQYWMPFYEGQGLHDADWRYYFGGSIYRGNGSHGCVNLPVGVAAELYSVVEVGTAIVIYYE